MTKLKNVAQYLPIAELVELKNNPRQISKKNFEILKESIQNNPEFFEAHPIIASNRTGENVVIAGNQRLRACKALGMDEAPVVVLHGLSEEQEREIIIRSNVENGEWDMDALANEWDAEELSNWGVDLKMSQYIGEDELQDISPLPQAYTKQQDVDFFESKAAIKPDFNYEKLEEEANGCRNDELKKVLLKRLNDFADYDFAYIADYYQSGASEEERRLLEAFGLVIATEKRALELDLLDLEHSVILSGGSL